MKSSNKVVLNTFILYGRMLITVGISLYSVRLVLNALGVVDYGIFNLIAGIIAMLSFLNTAMATSTQRYLSYHQGKSDIEMQKKVFRNSLLMHIGIGLIIVICLEIAGIFLFDGFLNIPINRVAESKIIFHFMSGTVFFTIISVPFNGSLVAHENMLWVAFVNIIETLLKFGIALFLYKTAGDKLIVYGMLTAGISVISFILCSTYCFLKYEDCTTKNIGTIDKVLMKELSFFASWNLFGALCGLGRTEGLAIIFNIFLGTAVNAAYGIANQVASQMNFFSATMLRALNPQIMKSEGAGDRKRMLRLSMMASKFGFFLLAIFAIPCIFEISNILKIWLKNVPDHTAIFCSLILLGTLFNQLTIGLQSALQATGKIKLYQSIVGTIVLLNIPLAYLLLKFDLPAYSVLASYVIIELVACSVRIVIAKKEATLNIPEYFSRVLSKEILPVAVSCSTCLLIVHFFDFNFRFLITGVLSAITFLISIYSFGLCNDEKDLIDKLASKFTKIIFRSKSAIID